MKKIIFSVFSLIVLITLSGCQDKFDPQTAIQESRTTLNSFLNSHSDEDVIIESYDKEKVENYFIDDEKNYFTDNFKKNILPTKMENLSFDSEKDSLELSRQFLFLAVRAKENKVLWNEVKTQEDKIDTDKESVTFYVSSKYPSFPSRYVEMIKENGKWKINNILEL